MADTTEARPVDERAPADHRGDAPDSGSTTDRFAPSRVALSPAFEVSKRPSPTQRIQHLWQYRELLGNLVRKELKVKYKNSVLGFVWSLLNPLMYLVVFSLVFQAVLLVKVPYYGIFFLAGLLAWNFFSSGVMGGTSAIVQNAQLVTKVWFPREALVLASLGAAVVHFLLQSLVLIGGLIVFQRAPSIAFLPTLLLALVVLLVFSAALAIALSAVNVYLRDTQHLLEVAMLAWFWVSAIAYPYRQVADRLGPGREWFAALNPVLSVVIAFQKVIYNPKFEAVMPPDAPKGFQPSCRIIGPNSGCTAALPDHAQSWYLTHLGVALLVSVVLCYGALRLFSRLEDNFAEEI